MSRALSLLMMSAVALSCAESAPDATAPIEVQVFVDDGASVNSHGREFGTLLSGDQEVPPRATPARGVSHFELSNDGSSLRYKIIVAFIYNVFQAHIHEGAAGTNGPVVVWLFPSTTPGAGPPGVGRTRDVLATGTITAADLVGPMAGQPLSVLVDAMRAGNTYVNVHTSDGVNPPNSGSGNFPGGEIRGQIHGGH